MKKIILTLFAILSFSISNLSCALTQNDYERCLALISYIQNQKNLIFIRNGTRYDAQAAASHLTNKLDYSKNRLKSVNEFIDHVASRSYLSGKDYEVILPGGKQITAKNYLYSILEESGK